MGISSPNRNRLEIVCRFLLHKALKGAFYFYQNTTCHYRLDIKKYFYTIDHYIRENLHLQYYLRYMDDMIVLGNDKAALQTAKDAIHEALSKIRLHINEKKDAIQSYRQGVDFLGFKLHNDRIKLRNANLIRFKRKLKLKRKQPIADFRTFLQSINGQLGYLLGGQTKRIVNFVFDEISFHDESKAWKMILT